MDQCNCYGDLHELEEVVTFMGDPEAQTADFNSCVCGAPFWKPARWAGYLPGLSGLSGTCTCKTPHLAAVGSHSKE